MANPDHIDQLMKGVAAWNAWREENPSISPDLSDASLIRTDLRHAQLFQANPNAAILADANLGRERLAGIMSG
jgi:uncharacterized protein YjbI with pentapeptide repeats